MSNDPNAKKKILLVDDDEMYLTTAELFLKKDYDIYRSGSGNEALDYLCNKKLIPDLILLDILMPNMDGWEVFKRIRAIDSLKNVPIAFLTSVEEESEKKRAFKMGIADYISKPFNMTDLTRQVKGIIK